MPAIRRYKSVDVGDSGEIPSELFHVVPTGQEYNQRITWGEPARIFQACHDKSCPCCGFSRDDGFDIGRDSAGSAFGGRCPGCEWTF